MNPQRRQQLKAAIGRRRQQSPLDAILEPAEAVPEPVTLDEALAALPPVSAPAKPKKRKLGRFPGGTYFISHPYDAVAEMHVVDLFAPDPTDGLLKFTVSHTSAHTCLELLWDTWTKFRDEQETAK